MYLSLLSARQMLYFALAEIKFQKMHTDHNSERWVLPPNPEAMCYICYNIHKWKVNNALVNVTVNKSNLTYCVANLITPILIFLISILEQRLLLKIRKKWYFNHTLGTLLLTFPLKLWKVSTEKLVLAHELICGLTTGLTQGMWSCQCHGPAAGLEATGETRAFVRLLISHCEGHSVAC